MIFKLRYASAHPRTHIVMIDTASGAKGVESLNQPVLLFRREGARFIQGLHSVPPSGQWAQGRSLPFQLMIAIAREYPRKSGLPDGHA